MGCSHTHKKNQELEPEEIYLKAHKLFKENEFTLSAEMFDSVERHHPYSLWASKGQIMAAYAYYKVNKYDEAITILNRFIQLHPGNRNTPYAFYLKGISYFEQMSNIEREQKMSEEALNTFKALVARYPNSIYKKDAEKKILLITDHIAGKEMEVGRFYEKNKDFIPAMNRYQNVLLEYSDTLQIPEAYYRLATCYYALGINGKAQSILIKLRADYPEVVWTQKLENLLK